MASVWQLRRPDCRLCERRAARLARALSAFRRTRGSLNLEDERCEFSGRRTAMRNARQVDLDTAAAASKGYRPATGRPIAALTGLYDGIPAPQPQRPPLTRAQAKKLRKRGKAARARVSAAPQGSSPVNGGSRGKRSAGNERKARRDANWPTRRRKGRST